jgi:ATPase family associated with various cellular activities (AAA)/Winged helix domain, variant
MTRDAPSMVNGPPDVTAESLPAALDRIYRALTVDPRRPERSTTASTSPAPAASMTSTTPAAATTPPPLPQYEHPCQTLQHLQTAFGLTPFERDILLLCLGAALESRFLTACAHTHGDPRATWPTFGMALSILDNPHWSVISRARPLRYWRLTELGSGPLLQAPLQIDEHILQYLLAIPALDERLDALIRPLETNRSPQRPDRSTQLPAALQSALRSWQRPTATPELLLLMGEQASTREAAFIELCGRCDCQPYVLHAADLPSTVSERETLARLWTRESTLTRTALYVQTEHLRSEEANMEQGLSWRQLTSWLQQVHARVALEVPHGSPAEQLQALRVDVPPLSALARRSAWETHLGPVAQRMNGALGRIVEYFHFDEPGIQSSAAAVLETTAGTDQDPGELTWHICRRYGRRTLDNLARRIEPRAAWADLILPAPQLESLRQVAIHLRQRARVNEEWGFSSRHSRGLGLSALFAGGSGTGKTLAAEILAGELDLDLYQIDLAGVVSKYIGQTEKNLRRIFEAAEESGAILLFDEADALFGKRSEVRDSHDRYANLEISYLLQRMDSYRGMAILTTNMRHALDPAFMRRIRFIVQFPFPDQPSRERIWAGIFPSAAPLDGLDFARLAQLNVSGGVIRNIAMHAAFLAAEQCTAINPAHVLAAARTEYSKLDKPLTGSETRGWT